MKLTKTISCLLSAAIFSATLAMPKYSYAAVLGSSNIGEIVEFGKYYDEPIQYVIGGTRDVDGDGQEEIFLYSKEILAYKAYSTNNKGDWRKSTLRTWLNSSEAVVDYGTETPPSYASQPGFMSWFTNKEKGVMVPVTQKTLINGTLSPDGGSSSISWNDRWPQCYTVNADVIDTAYHVITTDTVFIPSIMDMYDYSMALNDAMAIKNSTVVALSGDTVASGKEKEIAVRDGHANNQNANDITKKIRYWTPTNSISVSWTYSSLGIRPCFYIEDGLEYTGEGTAEDPYKLIFPVSNEEYFENVLDAINAEDSVALLKIFKNEAGYENEYNALSEKGLLLEEMEENNLYVAVTDGLIAQKPSGGYTEDNIKSIFNRIVVSAMYDSADVDNKYSIIENVAYKSILGIASIKQGVAYNLVKNGPQKNGLFEGLSANELSANLEKKIIISAVNGADNASDMRDVIEENAETIGIVFQSRYQNLLPDQIGMLYGEMISGTTPYSDYQDIKTKFDYEYEQLVSSIVDVLGNANVGQYVEFGKYHDVPVQYVIGGTRDVDGDGVPELFLYSKEILAYKAYSTNGKADWRKSTLRTWLNSIDQTVDYGTETAPSYSSQPGFMSWFTDSELKVMVPVTQKTLISDSLSPDGGTNNIGWNDTWPGCYTNAVGEKDINTAYHVLTTDTVFIPSITDMYDYHMELNSGMAVAKSEVIALSGDVVTSGKEKEIAVRDGQSAEQIRYWIPTNSISVSWTYSNLGIRPCFYIKSGVGYTGEGTTASPYKLKLTDNVSDIALYMDGSESSWQNGMADVKVTFASGFKAQPINVYAVRYERNNDTVVAADIKCVSKNAISGEVIYVPMEIVNAENSYMKVIVTDDQNKALCTAEVFGTVSEEEEAEAVETTDKFHINEPDVKNTSVVISGVEKNREYSRVTIVAKRDSEVLYVDQKMVDKNNSFVFGFDGTNSFVDGVKTLAGGWYTVTVSSDYSDTVITKNIGISSASVFDDVIATINNDDKDNLVKILKKDRGFELEYNSLLGKDLLIEEMEQNALFEAVADKLISEKPETGYTADNLKSIFNKSVAGALFDASGVDFKYTMIETPKYREALGISSVNLGVGYNIVKNSSKKSSLFNGIVADDIGTKLGEKIVITASECVENASDMRSLIEENASGIGITLPDDYSALTSIQLKTLYDAMLGVNYTSYAEIKSRFELGYESAKKTSNTSSGGGSSGGGGGGGGGGYAAAPSKGGTTPSYEPEVKPQPQQKPGTFADVEGLSWGKDEIYYLVEKGIISGISKDSYMPDDYITREQFCRLIVAAYGIENTGDVPFADLKAGEWYVDAVAALYAGGFISGISETEFGVGRKISRQDMAVILYRVMGSQLTSENNSKEFSDMESINEYAKSAVDAMSAAGIINGYDDNSFRGGNNVTRREAAVMLCRALNLSK